MHVYAVDTGGNEPLAQPTTAEFTVPDGVGLPSGGGPGNGAAPTIQNVVPALNTGIVPETVVRFDVVDADDDLFDVVLFAIFVGTGNWEVIWDGDQFSPRYLQGSRRDAIATGFRYTLKRAGGWPETPKIRARAFDANRNPLA